MYAVITNTCVIYIFNVTSYVLTDALIIQYNSLYETNLISSNQHIFYTKEREREREKKGYSWQDDSVLRIDLLFKQYRFVLYTGFHVFRKC